MLQTQLLDQILSMIHSVKDDQTKLQKLYEYMINEIVEQGNKEVS